MDKVYDYEYFKNKTPFRNVLAKSCDLSIYCERTGSRDWGFSYHYTISYDQKKFVENLPEIKKALLRTKICKCLEPVRNRVETIPEALDDFENAYAINKVFGDLVWDGCLTHNGASRSFEWEVENKYASDFEFNKRCVKKMTRPIIRLWEVNAWERESWGFYFDYPDGETFELIKQLSERFAKMPKVRQLNGNSYFELSLVPREYNFRDWSKESSCGYMPKHNWLNGQPDLVKLKYVLSLSDNGLFEFFYKGGIRTLFETN